QCALLGHDAEPAAASYRLRLCRKDRMGPAAGQFPFHPGPDDRHFRPRHHLQDDDRQPGYEGDHLSPSALPRRYAAGGDRGQKRARIAFEAGPRHRRIRAPGLQPERCAGGALPAAGDDHEEAGRGKRLMRSLLFVPADSERKLDRARKAGADALILDLEDSVAPERKSEARRLAAAFLAEWDTPAPVYVRINGLTTGLADDDLMAVMTARPMGIMLPKGERGRHVARLAARR